MTRDYHGETSWLTMSGIGMHRWVFTLGACLLVVVVACHDPVTGRDQPSNPIVPPFAGGQPPQAPVSTILTGQAQSSQEDPMAELRAHRARLDENPGDLDALIAVGNAMYDTQHFSAAESLYRRALDLDPVNVYVRTDLATALHRQGKDEEAILELQRVLVVDYRHETALYNLGVLKHKILDDPEGAIAVWEQLIDVTGDRQLAADLRNRIAGIRDESTASSEAGSAGLSPSAESSVQ